MANSTDIINRTLKLVIDRRRTNSAFLRFVILSILAICQSPLLFAQFSGGDGSAASPYQIANASDLNNIRNYMDKHFILITDIDLNVSPYNTGSGWDPIGSLDAWDRFTGSIDGNGYVIDNLYISRSGENSVGLIGGTNYGEIKNLGLRYVDITGNSHTGGIIGFNGSTQINNCFVTGTIHSAEGNVGGLTGTSFSGSIKDSYTTVSVSADGSFAGGLTGSLSHSGTIEYSLAYGSVSVDDAYAGGLVGSASNSTISYSYASGSISGNRYLGGLSGGATGVTISDSYASGSVNGSYNLGGFVGRIGYDSYLPQATFINNSYSTGLVTGDSGLPGIGGFIGTTEYASYLQGDNNFWDTQSSGQTESEEGAAGITGLTTAQMKTQSTFTDVNWNFDVVWGMSGGTNNGYPFLHPSPPFGDGLGTEEEPFKIATVQHLNEVRNYLSNHFIVVDDIFMADETNNSGGDFWNGGEGWEPIGNSSERFTGVFNGNGRTIEGMTINRPSSGNQGLFGHVYGGTIKNVGLVDVDLTVGGTSGGVTGVLDNTSAIDQVYVTGSIDGSSIAGGIAGYATGNSVISNSYSIAELRGSDGSGGVVGFLRYGAEIQRSFAAGSVTSNNSGDRVGGLVGLVRDGASVSYSYFDSETTGQTGGEGGTALTHAQMVAASNFTSWDFTEVWDIEVRDYDGYFSYPYLRNLDTEVIPGKTQNSTPFATNVTIEGVFEVNETLHGEYTYVDLDGDEEAGTTFKWYRADDASGTNKSEIPGVDQQDYWVQSADRGKYLSFEVTFGDAYGSAEPFESGLIAEEPPLPAVGVFATGAGTIGNPYQITTAEHLNEVRNYLSSYFILMADIDLDVAPFNSGSGWEPIGTEDEPFTGTFDGNGYVIDGLYTDRFIYVGLFGFTVNSEIIDLGITNANVIGEHFVGVLAGWQGADFGNNLISGSYATGTLISSSSEGGGLVGRQQATGGTNTIENSFASVNVTGSNYAGGLVAAVSTSSSSAVNTINQSYSTGYVSGYSNVGGLVGISLGSSGTNTQQNSYWNTQTSGRSGSALGTGKSTSEMKNESTFSSWDFDNTWGISGSENSGYPHLREVTPAIIFGGKGTLADPYQISTAEELEAIRSDLGAHYIIINDITLDVESDNSGRGWEPIGDWDNPFTGSLDGGGYIITGLYSKWDQVKGAAGFFGVIKNANITNVHLSGVFVSVNTNSGGLVGIQYANNGSSSITKCSVSGEINGQFSLGGIIGKQYANDGQNYIQYSYSAADIFAYTTPENSDKDDGAGLVGFQESDNNGSNHIQVSYSRSFEYFGAGIVGKKDAGTSGTNLVINSFFDTETAPNASANLGGTGRSTSDMKTQSTFTDTGWDFTDVWGMDENINDGYPYLRETPVFEEGDGSSGDPYQIETAAQFSAIRNYTSSHFILKKDIDLGSFAYNSVEGWDPIESFSGVLNGDGYKVKNMVINRPSESNIGLFGYSGGTIKRIGLEDVKITSGSNSGGVVGFFHSGTISETYVTGEINGGTNSGGLVGEHHGRIVNSYSIASIDGGSNVGGLVGFSNYGEVDSSYSTGTVTGSGSRVLGFIGYSSGGSSTASYWDRESSGVSGSYGGSSNTSFEMKISGTFTDWDFSELWAIKTGESLSYPYLRAVEPDQKPGYEVLYESGDGTSGDPYLVSTPKQLHAIRLSLGAHYKLTDNIDLEYATQNSAGAYWNDGEGWEPLGNSSGNFTGSFNGDGYAIRNLFINRPSTGYQGLFGVGTGASISKLALEDIQIVGSGNSGGLIGYLIGSGSIDEIYITGSLEGGTITGGIVGYLLGSSSITNSYTVLDILGGDATGGLVGYSRGSTIEKSFSGGSVLVKEGGQRSGGLIALSREGSSISNSYWNAQISAETGEGGSARNYIQMMDSTAFSGFGFGEEWDIYNEFGYPFLKNVGTHRMSSVNITGEEGWRLMTAPRGGITFGELLEPLWTQGFEGADHEEGSPNVLEWNASTGAFQPISSADDVPHNYQGFLVYVYADHDYDGEPDSFPKRLVTEANEDPSAVQMQFSYNSGLPSAQRGWGLAGNPWGFPLDWSSSTGWSQSGFESSMYIWNSEAGEYQSHNGMTGTLPSSVIAPWQAFWVKATGGDATLSLTKEVRGFNGVFRKQAVIPQLELTLKNEDVSSKTVVMFAEGALEGKDKLDAYKLASLSAEYVSIGTSVKNSDIMDIQALPLEFDEPIELEVYMDVNSANSEFELNWNTGALPEGFRFQLIDKNNNETKWLNTEGSLFLEIESISPVAKVMSTNEVEISHENDSLSTPNMENFNHIMPTIMGKVNNKRAKASGSQKNFILRILPPDYVDESELPVEFALSQNYPNPFNPVTSINFDLPEAGEVQMEVFDIMGRKVATLVNGPRKAGYHQIRFDAGHLASGMYLYRLKAGKKVFIKKLTLIK